MTWSGRVRLVEPLIRNELVISFIKSSDRAKGMLSDMCKTKYPALLET